MFGPFVVVFDSKAVSDYLNGNPTAQEKNCMDAFFITLQDKAVNVPHKDAAPFSIADACGYIIEFRYLSDDREKVRAERISRAGINRLKII
jgi:hypothetical protein